MILKYTCEQQDSVSLGQFTEIAETSRTTALRIVSSLCNQGFLSKTNDGCFEVGDTLRSIAEQLDLQTPLPTNILPVLKDITEVVRETAHYAIPSDTHCFLKKVVDSPNVLRVASRSGALVDYHCSGTGKSMLAFDPALAQRVRDRIRFTARTPNTLLNWTSLDNELKRVNKRGYAVDEEEYHIGVRCVGVPVFRSDGKLIGAIGITGPTTSVSQKRLPEIAKVLQESAKRLL